MVWDARAWKEARYSPEQGEERINDVLPSSDGVHLFGLFYNRFAVYDIGSWKSDFELLPSSGLPKYFYGAALSQSQDGKVVAIAGSTIFPNSDDGSSGSLSDTVNIVFVDISQQKMVRNLSVTSNEPLSSALSPDGKFVATGSSWSDESGDSSSPSSSRRGSSAYSRTVVRVFDSLSGRQVASASALKEAEVDALLYTSDGRYLIGTNIDGLLKLWDAKTMTLRDQVKLQVSSIALSRDGRFLAVGEHGKIVIFEID